MRQLHHFRIRLAAVALLLVLSAARAATAATPVIVDNTDKKLTSRSGTWFSLSTADVKPYGINIYVARGSGQFNFLPKLPTSTYDVYVRWGVYSQLSSAVNVLVQTAKGPVTVAVNQNTNGGQWNYVGTYAMTSTSYVRIIVPSRGVACADAVKFEVPGTPPPAPTGFLASGVVGGIELNWDDAARSDLKFNVYRAPASGGYPTVVASGLTLSKHLDLTALPGIPYLYVVTAVAPGGQESDPSAEAEGTALPVALTPVDPVPGPPVGLAAAGGDALVDLSWAAPGDTDLAGYRVYRSLVAQGGFALVADLVKGTTFRDVGLSNGTTYYYVVTSMDQVSQESVASVVAAATPVAAVAPPTLASVTVSWSAPTRSADGTQLLDLAGYKVYCGKAPRVYDQSFNVGNVTSYRLTGLPPGTYYLTVSAVDSAGNESVLPADAAITLP